MYLRLEELGALMRARRELAIAPLGAVASLSTCALSVLSWKATVLGLEAAVEQIRESRSRFCDRRILFYYLIEDAIPLLVVIRRAGDRLGGGFTSVCGDTWMGYVVSKVLGGLGRRTLPLRFGHAALSIRDVKALVREPGPLTIAADGRGPYGRVHPDLRRLVEGRKAIAIPLAVRISDRSRLCRVGPASVPLPGAKMAIAVGAPIIAVAAEVPVSTEELEGRLREARAAASSLLKVSGPRE